MKVLHAVRAVLWGFFGVRQNSEYRKDLGKLNPFIIIAVALVLVALFVTGLITLARWVAGT